jgi:hypothetical protein
LTSFTYNDIINKKGVILKKYYNLIIDKEIIPFDYVEIDPITQIPSDEVSAMYEVMFNSSNKLIDISSFQYDQIVGIEWD